jgi:hypothetical protein
MLRWRNLAAALDLGSSVEKREGVTPVFGT